MSVLFKNGRLVSAIDDCHAINAANFRFRTLGRIQKAARRVLIRFRIRRAGSKFEYSK